MRQNKITNAQTTNVSFHCHLSHLQVTESGEKILCVLKWVGHLHFKESFQASWLVPIRSVEPSLALL